MDPRTRESRTREPLQSERGSIAARVIAIAALVAAVALLALAMFGGGNGYRVNAVFESAGQLVNGNQVRVGGAVVGSISDIELNDAAQAVVTMEIDDEFAPLHQGTQATIRATSLSGIANRYISLQPGPNSAEEIDDGGQIDADETSAPVDIDVLFNTLDDETREGLRNLVRGSGTQYDGRGQDANESIKYFAPFLSSTTEPDARAGPRSEGARALRRATAPPRCRRSRSAATTSSSSSATRAPRWARSPTRTSRSRRRSTCCPTRCARPTRPS